jgi:predicted ester cyclase
LLPPFGLTAFFEPLVGVFTDFPSAIFVVVVVVLKN